MQLEAGKGRRFAILDAADNVATLLDDETDSCRLGNGLEIELGIPFGHKVSLAAMDEGAAIIKYGVSIGTATQPISCGAHVHVHNCR